jgi:ABC-2 type transport system permease protein
MSTRAPQRWPLVAAREVQVKLTDRNFLISTAASLLIIVGVIVVPALIGGGADGPTSYDVAVTDDAGAGVLDRAAEQLADDGGDVLLVPVTRPDREQAEQAVLGGEVDAALVGAPGGWELLSDGGAPSSVSAPLEQAISAQALQQNAAAAGTTVEELTAGSGLDLVDVGEATQGLPPELMFIPVLGFAMVFYLASIVFGVQIANSVVEEKQSRIVEILAAVLPTHQLLLGKIIGNTLLAFAQLALFAAAALIGLGGTDCGVALPGLATAIGWYLPFFALGFLGMACVWAAAGSLASRTEDVQSTTMPLQLLLVAVFIGAINLSGRAQEIASFVPLASTMLMPARILVGDTQWWEPLLALGLVLVFCAVTIWLGARLYQRALLHTSGSLTWRKAFALRD